MDVATDRKTLSKSRRTGMRRLLSSRLQGSRKRAVLAAVTAFGLERSEEERYGGEPAKEILDLLEVAKRAIDDGNIQAGWACFLAARRMRVLTVSEDRIAAESIALLEEAQEFSGWRGKAIKELLDPTQEAEPRDRRKSLYVAYEIRDEARQNRYHEVEILREQLLRLGVALALTVLGILATAIWLHLPLAAEPNPAKYHVQYVVYVALFGALGGSISAIQWVIKHSTSHSGLPERRMYGPVVYMRPIFGVAAALAVFPFLVGGILPVDLKNNALILSVALAAGFTERLIASAVRTVTEEGPERAR